MVALRHPELAEGSVQRSPEVVAAVYDRRAAKPPSSRSQVFFGNAIVRATSLLRRRKISNEIASASAFPNKIGERENPQPRPIKKARHPERSEASDSLSPQRVIRAQSKDLADFPKNRRSAAGLLHERPARRHEMTMSSGIASCTTQTTRSFDYGSANPSGKRSVPLAFAQDDGVFKRTRSGRIGSEAAKRSAFPIATWERGTRAIRFLLIALIISISTSGILEAASLDTKPAVEVTFLTDLNGESVELYSVGKKVYEGSLRCLPTGTAGTATFLPDDNQVHLKVVVPKLGLTESTNVNLSRGTFLYVTVEKDRISFVQEKKSRGYE